MNEKEMFEKALNGNAGAVKFCMDIFYIAHLWDDLIDKDKYRTGTEISKGFELALLGLPNNEFYRNFEPAIRPMLHTAISAWYESNKIQNGNEQQRFYAFFLRNLLLNVTYFACIVVDGDMDILHEYIGLSMFEKYKELLNEEFSGA